MPKLPDNVVLDGIVRLIPSPARQAIVACCRRGYGEARDLRGILAQARRAKAPAATVAAAFAFLPSLDDPRAYVDVTDAGQDAFDTAVLPDEPAGVAAFALARAVLGTAELAPVAYTPR